MGRTIHGPAERVNAFHAADFRQFVAKNYGPDQIILAASGAVDHDEIVRQAETLFADLKPRNSFKIAPANFATGECRVEKNLEQAHFTLAIEGPGYKDPDIYTAQVFATAFGGGMSSRLFQEIREKRGLCYTIYAQTGAHELSLIHI